MSESIRLIKFDCFRGLPKNEFKLKGKSLVVLGSNGKGKSALVDGIEFVFSGQVARFTGTGTGSISHDDAVKNVKTGGDPVVVLSLSPSNGEISRKLSSDETEVTDRQPVKDFFEQHPGVDGFVLRRAKMLEFICDQDADRYQKFVQLLGFSKMDKLQRSFVTAEQQARTGAELARQVLRAKLAAFNDPVNRFIPDSLEQVLIHINEVLEVFDTEKVEKWDEVEDRLILLKAKRPQVNREKIDTITRALVSIENPIAILSETDVNTANDLRAKLAQLTKSSADAQRSKIIDEGRTYLSDHDDETHCPLCEATFQQPLEDLLLRLKDRSDTLQELRDTESSRNAALGRIKNYANNVSAQLKNDLQHSALIESDTVSTLRNDRAAALRFSRLVDRAINDSFKDDLPVPERLQKVAETRKALADTLSNQKAAMLPPDTTKLEAAITLMERAIVSRKGIELAEQETSTKNEILRRTVITKNAFSSSREYAIQQVFTHISGTVLEYYKRLHDLEGTGEKSECTALELTPTSRAQAGGLRLAIQFLGLANSSDPRTYLSEGHLDSLGLCIFLAAVRIFNPPGSLLVLDDVLTSIDREHRRRVGELLLSEFQDYQIILTTHDEYWHDLLATSTRAFGVQDKWRFIKLEGWTVETGPVLSVVENNWTFIDEHLTEADYRNLGGPFRVVIENFMKRTASKIELKVKFRSEGKYTAGDFVASGLQDRIRDELLKLDSNNTADIRIDIARVFGQGDLINFLSHDNTGRLEVTFDQASDFVTGLKSLIGRCEAHKLIKGR